MATLVGTLATRVPCVHTVPACLTVYSDEAPHPHPLRTWGPPTGRVYILRMHVVLCVVFMSENNSRVSEGGSLQPAKVVGKGRQLIYTLAPSSNIGGGHGPPRFPLDTPKYTRVAGGGGGHAVRQWCSCN